MAWAVGVNVSEDATCECTFIGTSPNSTYVLRYSVSWHPHRWTRSGLRPSAPPLHVFRGRKKTLLLSLYRYLVRTRRAEEGMDEISSHADQLHDHGLLRFPCGGEQGTLHEPTRPPPHHQFEFLRFSAHVHGGRRPSADPIVVEGCECFAGSSRNR